LEIEKNWPTKEKAYAFPHLLRATAFPAPFLTPICHAMRRQRRGLSQWSRAFPQEQRIMDRDLLAVEESLRSGSRLVIKIKSSAS
jgi:hypothetical protein